MALVVLPPIHYSHTAFEGGCVDDESRNSIDDLILLSRVTPHILVQETVEVGITYDLDPGRDSV